MNPSLVLWEVLEEDCDDPEDTELLLELTDVLLELRELEGEDSARTQVHPSVREQKKLPVHLKPISHASPGSSTPLPQAGVRQEVPLLLKSHR